MNIKTLLMVSAAAVGGSLLIGGRKVGQYKDVLSSLQFNVKNVSGIKFQSGNVVFNTDVEIVNPTNTAIDIPGNLLTVKTIHFFTPSNNKIGIAHPNVSNIQLPANGRKILTNVPTTVDLAMVGKSFSEVIALVTDPKKLIVSTDVEVFGQSFTV